MFVNNELANVLNTCEFVAAGFSTKEGKVNKWINANSRYTLQELTQYFISNPNDCVALVVPKDYVIVDLDMPKNVDESTRARLLSLHADVVNYVKASYPKCIIIKTNNGYHMMFKNANKQFGAVETNRNGQFTYGLINAVDYKFGSTEKNKKGTSFAHIPIYTEHCTQERIKTREVIHIGVSHISELEDIPVVLQSPGDKDISGQTQSINWKVLNNSIFKDTPFLRDNQGREERLYTYGKRLVDLNMSDDDIRELLGFVGFIVMEESMDLDKIQAVANQMIKEGSSGELASNEHLSTFVKWFVLDKTPKKERSTNHVLAVQETLNEYVDKYFKDFINIKENVFIKKNGVYQNIGLRESKAVIAGRVGQNGTNPLNVPTYIKALFDTISTTTSVTNEELESRSLPYNKLIFNNCVFDTITGEIDYNVADHNYIHFSKIDNEVLDEKSVKPSYEALVEQYINSLTMGDAKQRSILDKMLGSILIRDMVKIKKFFIIYGPRGNNGKTSFLTLLQDIMGSGVTSSIELDTLLNNQFGLDSIKEDLLTTAGELEAIVKGPILKLKGITGGDVMEIKGKFKDTISKKIETTMIFASNHRTVFKTGNKDKDEAFNKRIVFVDFNNQFTEEENDFPFDPDYLNDKRFQQHFLLYMIKCSAKLREDNYEFPVNPYLSEIASIKELNTIPNTNSSTVVADRTITKFIESFIDVADIVYAIDKAPVSAVLRVISAWCIREHLVVPDEDLIVNKVTGTLGLHVFSKKVTLGTHTQNVSYFALEETENIKKTQDVIVEVNSLERV